MKVEPKDKEELKEEKEKEKIIEKQSKLFHKYRTALADLTKFSVDEILQANSQEVLSTRDQVSL